VGAGMQDSCGSESALQDILFDLFLGGDVLKQTVETFGCVFESVV
jgi:hypothetical protein